MGALARRRTRRRSALRPLDAAHLSRGLLELWPSYLAYALTFP